MKPQMQSEQRFMQACQSPFTAAELDSIINEMRRDQRMVWDVQTIARITRDILDGTASFPEQDADEIAGLLRRVRYLMETA